MRRALSLAAAALVSTSVACRVGAHEQATGVVKERMDAMELMAKAMKAITARIKEKRGLDPIAGDARAIHAAATRMPSLFPPGTTDHPSGAKPVIWRNWPDFEGKARALVTESAKLAEMESRDAKALAAQVRRVSDACSSCHELYRTKDHH